MTAFLDTNVLVRHLTGEPPEQARRATAYLAAADAVLLTDVVVAELVYVLESVYGVAAERVAELVRAVLAHPPVRVLDEEVLLRALEVHERHRLDWAEAYLVACAEASGVGAIASFDRALDRMPTVRRVEPAEPGPPGPPPAQPPP